MRPLLRVVLLAPLLAGWLAGAGAAQVRPVRLATQPAGLVHYSQSAARLPDGRFAAVWTQGRSTFLQYVDSHGNVAFGAPGRAVVTSPWWGGTEAVVVAHARSEIRFSAVDAAGNRLTPSDGVPLLRRTLAPSYTLIRGFAFDPASGSSFVVWESDRGAAALLYTPS